MLVMKENNLALFVYSSALDHFGQNWRLQMDNDPKHRSSICKEFTDESVLDLLDLLSNSPDANPIESISSIVKHNVEKKKTDEYRSTRTIFS